MAEYWDARYRVGGVSGSGSLGEMRIWKLDILRSYGVLDMTILDYGCGDLSFWLNSDGTGTLPPRYIGGVDVSKPQLLRNRGRFPHHRWMLPGEIKHVRDQAEAVTCFDVLFHILPEDEFLRVRENVFNLATRIAVVGNWVHNPFRGTDTDGKYQCFRLLDKYPIPCNWTLVDKQLYSDKLNAVYIYRRDQP